MPHMSLQSLHICGHGVEVFSIILLPRGLHSPKSGTGYNATITLNIMILYEEQIQHKHKYGTEFQNLYR